MNDLGQNYITQVNISSIPIFLKKLRGDEIFNGKRVNLNKIIIEVENLTLAAKAAMLPDCGEPTAAAAAAAAAATAAAV